MRQASKSPEVLNVSVLVYWLYIGTIYICIYMYIQTCIYSHFLKVSVPVYWLYIGTIYIYIHVFWLLSVCCRHTRAAKHPLPPPLALRFLAFLFNLYVYIYYNQFCVIYIYIYIYQFFEYICGFLLFCFIYFYNIKNS